MVLHSGVFYCSTMHRLYLLLFSLLPGFSAIAQPLAGTTGLLNIPSANMQKDGTFMTGANYLPVLLTPSVLDFNTANF